MKALHLNTTGLALLAIAGSLLLAANTQAQTLMGYWDFDELAPGNAVAGGNTVQDTAAAYPGAVDGVNHVGNAMGALTYVDSLAGFGSAIDFPNQNGAEIVIQNSGTAFGFQPGDFTISLWVNNRGFTRTWQAAIAKGEGNAWRVARQGNSQLLAIAANLGQDMPHDFAGNMTNNEWHHLCFTRQSRGNNATFTYWYDGVPFMDNAVGDTLDPRTGSLLTIGDNPQGNNRNWNGLIDDVAIWDATIECYKPPAIYHAGVELGYSMQELLLLFDAYDNMTSVTFNDPLTGAPVTWDYTAAGLRGQGTVETVPSGLGIQIGEDTSGMVLAQDSAKPSITKVANITEGAPGDLVNYSITYQNAGSGALQDVVFTDTLPAGMMFQSPAHDLGNVVAIDPAGNNVVVGFTALQTGNTLTLSLPPGYSLAGPNTLQFNVFTQIDPAQTSPVECLRNTLQVTGSGLSASGSATVTSLIPDVGISKSVTNLTSGAAIAAAGDILEYTITISNENGQAGLVLTDAVTGGTFVPGSVSVSGATVNMTPTSVEITWPGAAGDCVQIVGEHGAAEFAGGFHIDDPNYPSPILSAGDQTTFDPLLNPLGALRLDYSASTWFGGNYNWTQVGGGINNKNFNNGGGNVGSVATVCDEAAAWTGEDRMALFTGAGGFTSASLNNISGENQKTFVWHISPQSLSNGRQIVYEVGGNGTGSSLVLIDSRLYWTANFNPDFGQAMVDLSTIDYDPLVDFIRVVAVVVKDTAVPSAEVRLGAYNRCGQGVTDIQPVTDANGGGLVLGNWAGGDGAGLGQRGGGSIGGDSGARVTNLEGGGAFGNFIGAIANMTVNDSGANLPAPAPSSASCNCGDGTGYAGDGAISSGFTDPCWYTTTTFSQNNDYNHGGNQQLSEDIARQSKNHPEYGSSISAYREVVDFSNSGNVQNFASTDPLVGGNALFPNVGTNGGSDRFSNYSRGYILVETPGPYTFGVTHDDTMRLYIDGARVLAFNCCSGGGRYTTQNLTAGLHYVEAFVGENGGGDYIEVFWAPGSFNSFNTSFELTELADTVVYTTTVQACSNLGQWGKLAVDSVANSGYVTTEVLDAGGNVLIGTTTNATEIDLSAIPASTTDLVLRFTLKNEGCFANEGPLLEGWDASFICDECSSTTSLTYQVMVDECIAGVDSVDNVAEIAPVAPQPPAMLPTTTLTTITGGDAGEGLDFSLGTVVHAVDFLGPGQTVQGVTFGPQSSDPAITENAPNNAGCVAAAGAFGPSADDESFRLLAGNLVWENAGNQNPPFDVTFPSVPGREYLVDLIFWSGSCGGRFVDVSFNGQFIADDLETGNSVNGFATVLQQRFCATSGFEIFSLDSPNAMGNAPGGDQNPVISAILVRDLGPCASPPSNFNEINLSNNVATTSTPLAPVFDLAVSATSTAGASNVFTVTVLNNSAITSDVFTVDSVVSAGVTISAIPAGCTLVGNTVSCAMPALAPGVSTSLVIEVESACCLIGGVDLTATIVAACPDEDPLNDMAVAQLALPGDSTEPVVTVEPPDLSGICNVQPEPPLQATAILDIFNGTGVDISLLPAVPTGMAEGTDTCSVVTSYVDQATVFGCVANIVRTWTFLDECGLSTTYDQDINITLDTTPPVITADPSSPMMAVCTGGPITDEWTAGASVTDDCDPAPVVTYTNVSVATACGETVTRTWTAVDACGNTATVVQVFENLFNDTAAPTITPPADVAGCNMDTSPAALGAALASDDCTAATTPADCLVVNGDFENGDLLGWSIASTGPGTFQINDGVFDPQGPTPATPACNGSFSAANEQLNPGLRQLWQDVSIPAAPSATLTWTDQIFNQAFGFQDPNQEYRVLIVDPASGATSATAFTTNPGDAAFQPCTTRSFDVTPFAGQTVRIMFEVEDDQGFFNVYIDDVCIDINPVTPTFADTITMVGCTQVIERVWTSSDVCGNTAAATQLIENVLDTTPPVLTLPSDTSGCAIATDVAANGSATAVDACGIVTITNTDQVVMQGDNTIVFRTWIATDACGNETEGLQTIISLDVFGGPVVTVPPNTTACNGMTNMTDTGMGMITAGCCATGGVTVSVTDVITAGAAACEEIITRTWTASDDCGNTSIASQIITNYVDTTPPVIVVPAPVALCNGFTDPASVGMATATDDCLLVTNTWADTVTPANCLETIERVWTAVDFCGNVAVATQFISNVADAVPPTLTVPADTNGCNISTNTADTGMAAATDACGTSTVTFVDTVTMQDCVQTVFREWTATDECGSTTSAIQVISVVLDTAGPTLIVPADSVGCNLDTSVNANGAASATDDCVAPTIAWMDTTNSAGCVVTISRLWYASDDCGNMSTGVQMIVSTVDTDAPVLTVPADFSQCNPADTTPATTGMGSATDVCGASTTTWSDVILTTPCSTIIERTWTATDDCGNSTSAVQQIESIADTTGPIFTFIPADLSLCMGDTSLVNTGTAQASDPCSTATISWVDNTIPQPKGDLIERIWTATDACGNTASVTQMVFNYTSTTPPPITIPPDVDDCNIQTPPFYAGQATSTDPEAVITYSDSEQIIGCARVIIRTWTASDACLSSSGTQLVQNTIDVSAPTIYVPEPVRLCNPAATDPSVAGLPQIIETCSAPTVTWSDTTNAVSACAEEIIRTWTAVDGCGNSNSADQIITVVNDAGAPVLSGIPADVFACNSGTSAEALAGPDPVITDDCMTMMEVGDDVLITNCMYRLVRTWTVVDECGNATSVSQTVILQSDSVAPVLTAPASTNVCNATDLSPAAMGTATAIEGCNSATVDFNDVAVTSGCQVVITRTWTAIDLCNNVAESDQIIVNSIDTEAPTWDFFPADTNVCNVASINPLVGTPTAIDNCNVTVELTDETSTLINCEFIVTRTWTASDDCGNSIVGTQTVVSQADLNGPTITLPPDVEGCNMADTSPAAAGMATAVDGCSAASVTWSDVTNSTGCAVIITRTWSAIDGCDQVSTADQIIMDVVDNVSPPVITVADESHCIIGNGAAPDPAPATAVDDCGTATLTSTNSSSIAGCIETIVITWTATDACGNSDSVDQTITIERDASFGWDVSAAADAMGCNLDTAAAAAGEPVVTSDCGATASFSDEVTTLGCVDTIVRTWMVADICGGVYTHTQTLTSVIDTDAPGLVPPADESGCNLDTTPGEPTLSADCTDVTVTHSDAVSTVDCTTTILRTWTATDGCGNSTSAVQTIETVVDAQPPTLSIPAGASGCRLSTDVADTGMATATDACGTPDITFEDTTTQDGVVITITRTWTATDDCGNQAVDVQTIVNIDDTTPPVIDTPADIVGCNLFLTNAAALATATDDSGGNVTVSFTDTTNTSGCIVTIERTWMAADDCGNMSTSPQSIVNTLDLEPPVLTVPDNMSGCNIPTGPGSAGQATATDNCNVTVTFSDATVQNGCEVIITRTWTATDDCGHEVSGVQMISVTSDTTDPTLTCPADIAVVPDANGDLVVPDLTAMVSMSDDCGATLTQSPAAGTVFGNVDVDNFRATATVQLIAVDGCGNETVCEVAVRNVSCIGDLVYNDLNANGAFDAGEPGVPNIMVTVADASGIIGTTITDADGRYLFFMDAAAGTAVARGTAVGGPYTVTATLPDGSQESMTVASLPPGEHVTTADIPLTLNGTVNGTVWLDLNADGDPSNENLETTGLGGIEVNLYDADSNIVATATTNPDGSYSFADVPPGDYTVGIGASSLPASLDTGDIALTSVPFNVPSGGTVSPPEANFGFIGTPTAIGLESISASGGSLSWNVADEAGILGYNIIDLATGTAVNDALILAGSGAYRLDVGPGNYALESLDSNLNTDREAEITHYAEADASPLGEPTKFVAAINGAANFTTDADTRSYLVTGVGADSIVLDLTDPDRPVRLIGEVLRTDSGTGVYFSYPAGATIEVK